MRHAPQSRVNALTLALVLAAGVTIAARVDAIRADDAGRGTEEPGPLLTYAATHPYPSIYDASAQQILKKRLDQVTSDLSKDPPPEANCAQTLGAKRFSVLLDDLGGVYSSMGEDAKAAVAYSKALACNPRADFLHAQLAAALLGMDHYDEARAELDRQLTLGRASFSVYTLFTQLDFIQDRWQDAATHARLAVAEAPDEEQATYWQCFLWLAQKRLGAAEPVLVERHQPASWPTPILASLQGKITEADVVEAIEGTHEPHRQHEILTEALFYTGEKRLGENNVAAAADYFTAAVNLRVPYFIEHHLAAAELSKLRGQARP